MKTKHSLLKSFQFAFEGISVAAKNGRNFRIQVFFATLTLILAFIFHFNPAEWIDLILVINLVLILELINTAIESLTDIVSPEIRNEAKIVKDVTAAAVLIASIGSIFIAAFLFIPKIYSLF